ncbi:MAG TPA: alpha-ribazole phosphatase [Bryobacteraceae bacterium]|nr:alpha-ribazole phosphatase [Bryobacteraceae bacterium]
MHDGESPTVTRFWLIRHGEPASEIRGRCYGSLDVGLSETGRRRMQEVAHHLSGEPLAAIYSSPRRRATESAAILAGPHACSVTIEPALREIDFGDFEGRTYDEIAARYPALYRQWMETPTTVQFPNGESFERMRRRVLTAFAALRRGHQGSAVAVVTHGGVIRILLGSALRSPRGCLFRMAQRYAALNLLSYLGDHPSVELLNG